MSAHIDPLAQLKPSKENFVAVSVVIPFDSKIMSSQNASIRLEEGRLIVKRFLFEKYPGGLAAGIMEKLHSLYQKIDFNTQSKGVAIYVSPMFEKIIYLNMEVVQNICVSDSFNIKDLLKLKRISGNYNVLVLSDNESTMYSIEKGIARRVFASTKMSAENDSCKTMPVQNMDRRHMFLRNTDNVLDNLLSAYPYPLFVAGNATMLNQFKENSRNESSVIEYFIGEDLEKHGSKIVALLKPFVEDLKLLNQKKLIAALRTAELQGRLLCGLGNVVRAVTAHTGTILFIEENYLWQKGKLHNGVVFMKPGVVNPYSYVKDTIGFIIEKMLEHGGTVEIAERNSLHPYQHIALIK